MKKEINYPKLFVKNKDLTPRILHNRRLAEILDIMVDRNNKGIELEKKVDIESAIKLYEQNVVMNFLEHILMID